MRADAAVDAGNLLAAANRDLIAARAAGDFDALRTIRITASSGYRSRDYQAQLWRKYFTRYYNQTVAARAKLRGGPHGDEAVGDMVQYVSPKIGAPGFSNHQAGLAIDFRQERTRGNTIENSTKPKPVAAWRASWFHRWLNINAARFGFSPYIVEPWHWEYRPAQPAVRPAGSLSPAASAQPSGRSVFGTVFQQIQDAVRRGQELVAIGLALQQGIRNENDLTDLIFFARHPERVDPERGRRKMVRGEPQFEKLSKEWEDIRGRLVQPALRVMSAERAPVAPPILVPTSAAAPPLGGPRLPRNFRLVKRHGQDRGLSRDGGDRLDRTLQSWRNQGITSVSNEDIDTFQRIANVETGGHIQGINTWDSAVLSLGFMQWTLQHGKLQEWIKWAEPAFQRYGIALSNGTYKWYDKDGKLTGEQQAIKGAAIKEELRWDGWAERFFLAGLDAAIIEAEVKLAARWLERHLNGLKKHLANKGMLNDFAVFKAHYDRSLQIRGIFQAAYNNLPAAAKNGTTNALQIARADSRVSPERFLNILQDSILKAYADRNDNGKRIITETQRGAQFDQLTRATGAVRGQREASLESTT